MHFPSQPNLVFKWSNPPIFLLDVMLVENTVLNHSGLDSKPFSKAAKIHLSSGNVQTVPAWPDSILTYVCYQEVNFYLFYKVKATQKASKPISFRGQVLRGSKMTDRRCLFLTSTCHKNGIVCDSYIKQLRIKTEVNGSEICFRSFETRVAKMKAALRG